MPPPYMEDALGIPLRDALAVMQRRIKKRSMYHGIPIQKNPLDLWVYQEVVHALRPDVVVEVGVLAGGSTLWFAHTLDVVGGLGVVIGVDVDTSRARANAVHRRVMFVEGDATDLRVVAEVRDMVVGARVVMVVEDSSHTYANTVGVLDLYSPLVTPGSLMIVEDGICHHGLDAGPSPGPYEAVKNWLPAHPEFAADRSLESFLVTWNPGGFLRRLR
jgi:cephalosporin hydroxylase